MISVASGDAVVGDSSTWTDSTDFLDYYVLEELAGKTDNNFIRVGKENRGGWKNVLGILRYNFTDLPGDPGYRDMTSARLAMRQAPAYQWSNTSINYNISIHRITENWTPAGLSGLNIPSYDPTPMATLTVNYHYNAPDFVFGNLARDNSTDNYYLDLDQMNIMINEQNYGWLIKDNTGANSYMSYGSMSYFIRAKFWLLTRYFYWGPTLYYDMDVILPKGLKIMQNVTVDGDLYVGSNILAKEQAIISDTTHFYVPGPGVSQAVKDSMNNLFDEDPGDGNDVFTGDNTVYHLPLSGGTETYPVDKWSTVDVLPEKVWMVNGVLDTIDFISNRDNWPAGQRISGGTYTYDILASHAGEFNDWQNVVYVDGHLTLNNATIAGPFTDDNPGIIVARYTITLSGNTVIPDNVIFISREDQSGWFGLWRRGAKITVNPGVQIGTDHSADPEGYQNKVNMLWAYSAFPGTAGGEGIVGGEVIIHQGATVWANIMALRKAEVAGNVYGGIYCGYVKEIKPSAWDGLLSSFLSDGVRAGTLVFDSMYQPRIQGAIWVDWVAQRHDITTPFDSDNVKYNYFSEGLTLIFNNIYPYVYFAGKEMQFDGLGMSEQ